MELARLFGINLKHLREAKGWSQAKLAEKSRLSNGTISAYEQGRRWPDEPYLQAVAEALELPITAFFVTPETNEAVQAGEPSKGSTKQKSKRDDIQAKIEEFEAKQVAFEEEMKKAIQELKARPAQDEPSYTIEAKTLEERQLFSFILMMNDRGKKHLLSAASALVGDKKNLNREIFQGESDEQESSHELKTRKRKG